MPSRSLNRKVVKMRPGESCWKGSPIRSSLKQARDAGNAKRKWILTVIALGVTGIRGLSLPAAFLGPRTPLNPTTTDAATSVHIRFGMSSPLCADVIRFCHSYQKAMLVAPV
ncbi:hypothetical protein L207DRAFT_138709 [Hyaloscypha variabilis F]|uniref:Uncharacterized protein n=1 Tax=Hyaloscypha variabilis (strain UAMH 11265 / GT02V1 / F) TaxID=1149755 RepID=A0A2J6R700_HYAVF|nr:hypothetical protein L207DRAFT_138709 [Hyaloscypha variabilis F]